MSGDYPAAMTEGLALPSPLVSMGQLAPRPSVESIVSIDRSVSALDAFTDFRRKEPRSVDVQCPLSYALAEMARFDVHSLLVTRRNPTNSEPLVVGLVTCACIERRVRRASGHVCVEEIMTPWNELPLVHVESLQSVSALDMYERFQGTGLTHVLVVEECGENCVIARGLVSRSSLAKHQRLAAGVSPTESGRVAHTGAHK
jgi:CBS domain-containing protein